MSATTHRIDCREEIVNGEIRELPPPSPDHANLIDRLVEILRDRLNRRQYIIRTGAFALGIRRGSKDCRNPDLAVFRREDLKPVNAEGNNLFATPLLIVECLSPGNRRRDVGELLRDYSAAGVPEVWLPRPDLETLTRHVYADGELRQREMMAGRGAVASPAALPSVDVPLDELWQAFAAGL